jgi:ribonuclease BN (tRNA processing enzyme)
VDQVLQLDGPGALRGTWQVTELAPGARSRLGPFRPGTWLLPHFVPSLGLRLTADGQVLAYTGDTGPSPDVAELAGARPADALAAAGAAFSGEITVAAPGVTADVQ